ncbi:histidine phosphatase family protein [Enterococcus wangshanyuanii]|uniref:Phosphoglycerate mutase n=1 Tax=Enterococcus wangshanyuanii TaxID=2005703 RepID=A0ABQ1PAD0_9ENTE|nr:histidine phosphatase family protein [Enterococcus wangshanyuanii]GGC92364.1 phosphoglycerate mutase [Enterococcus wangshanyuanii]
MTTQTLYLMRHGETLFNQKKKIQGWCDSPLTEKGIRQAQIAGEYFRQQGIVFDNAYASTSERASDTLEQVTSMAYQRIKGLKEWNFGAFESESESLNPSLPYGDFFAAYGGEKEAEFRDRIAETVFSLMKNSGEIVLAVSHGAACRQFMRAWAHTSSIDQKERLSNCCILKFEFEDDAFRLLEIINHDFSNL